ncbi:MAG: tetratricopeptide repeat protein [Cyanothece sp. SIO2G6]|nr:tetratricopeptide repeat protein [Cyanothece sp. SIO2G6]
MGLGLVAIIVIVGWIASVCLHEFGHAIVAYWGGDKSVKDKGYLTFNPTKYIDPQMSLVLPVIFLLLGGIALPGAAVYINHAALRNRLWRSAVSAAGPFASAIAAIILSIPFWFGVPATVDLQWFMSTRSLTSDLWAALALLVFLNIYMTFLNSLPIPPLDGFGVLRPWLSPQLQAQANKIGRYGIVILFGLIFFVPFFGQFLFGISFAIVSTFGISREAIASGYSSFREGSIPIVVGAIALFLVYQRFFNPHKRHTDQGYRLLQTGRYDAALSQFEDAIVLQSDHYDAIYGKGLALEHLERLDDAMETYAQAIALDSQRLAAYQRQAEIFTQQFRIDEAIACHQKMAALEPDNSNHEVAALFLAGQYEEAIAVYDQVLKLDDTMAEVWLNKAFCYSQLNDLDHTLSALTRAIELDSRSRQTARTAPGLAKLRDHPKIQALLVQMKPKAANIRQRQYLDHCQSALHEGNYEEALGYLEQAIALKPDFYEAYYFYLQGLTLECLERYDEAINVYGKAIALDPDGLESYRRRSGVLTEHGRDRDNWHQDVVAYYEKTLEHNPEDRFNQAAVLFFSEQYEKALEIYDDILESNSKSASAWHNRACCHSHLGDLEQVVKSLEKAIALDPAEKELVQTDPDLAQFREQLLEILAR